APHCCGFDAAVAAIRDQRSYDEHGYDLSCCRHGEIWDALGNCWVPVAPPHVPIVPEPGER
ncbi:MAG: hypothetical protein JWM47_4149, partial [Acidimicrobiales bacterium]|nr:hypothetical protein [Acidimicrobiales bacterium]